MLLVSALEGMWPGGKHRNMVITGEMGDVVKIVPFVSNWVWWGRRSFWLSVVTSPNNAKMPRWQNALAKIDCQA